MQYTIKRVRTFQRAARLWDYLNPRRDLFDSWEYRAQYYLFFPYPLFFYTAYFENRPVALAPLQWNEELQSLEFFGGKRFSYNDIFVLPGHDAAVPELLRSIKKRVLLDFVREPLPGLAQSQPLVPQYRLSLQGISCLDDYFDAYWHGKHRKQIKRSIRQFEEQKVAVSPGSVEDLDLLMALNLQRFGQRSNFTNPHRKDYLKNLMKEFDVTLFTVSLNGEKKAVSYSIFHDGGYYGITSGADTTVPFLRKFLMLKKIEEAIRCGAKFYDAGRRNFGWKEQFKFQKTYFYTWSGVPTKALDRPEEPYQIPVEFHGKSF